MSKDQGHSSLVLDILNYAIRVEGAERVEFHDSFPVRHKPT